MIAGVNGAGKSTLYQTLENLKDMPRINTDEIVKSFGSWQNISDVLKGGHGIPDADVERRYTESFKKLKEIISLCDLAILYDNTESFNRFAIYKEGKLLDFSENRSD